MGNVTLNTGTSGGNIALTNHLATVINNAITDTDLTITSGGDITQLNNINNSGTASFNATGDNINLTNANNNFTTIVVNAINADVNNFGAINFSTSAIGNVLTANANGNITQSNAITVTSNATLNASIDSITFNDIGNNFSTVSLTGTNATITDKNALNFETTTISINLTATTNGDIT